MTHPTLVSAADALNGANASLVAATQAGEEIPVDLAIAYAQAAATLALADAIVTLVIKSAGAPSGGLVVATGGMPR